MHRQGDTRRSGEPQGVHLLEIAHRKPVNCWWRMVWCVQRPWWHGRNRATVGSVGPAWDNILAHVTAYVAFDSLHMIVPAHVAMWIPLALATFVCRKHTDGRKESVF